MQCKACEVLLHKRCGGIRGECQVYEKDLKYRVLSACYSMMNPAGKEEAEMFWRPIRKCIVALSHVI